MRVVPIKCLVLKDRDLSRKLGLPLEWKKYLLPSKLLQAGNEGAFKQRYWERNYSSLLVRICTARQTKNNNVSKNKQNHKPSKSRCLSLGRQALSLLLQFQPGPAGALVAPTGGAGAVRQWQKEGGPGCSQGDKPSRNGKGGQAPRFSPEASK